VPTNFDNVLSSISGRNSGPTGKAVLIVHEAPTAEEIKTYKDVLNDTKNALSKAGAGAVKAPTTKSHRLVVQYNPSTLSMQANAEPIPFTYLQQNIDQGIPNQNLRAPMVVLSVELYFDEMNPADAFMMDKIRLSAGNAITDAAAIAKTAKGGYTVQPQTNALLSTVLRPNTKIVTFVWGDMSFTGMVIEVEAEYTMFSPSGKPIRSRVQLNIAQSVESEADAEYWDKMLDKGLDGKGKTNAQKVSNLLNLNMF